MIWRVMKREWGAATFVITVVVGAIAVAISLIVNGTHTTAVTKPPPCPVYTPWPSLSPGATLPPTPTPTPFNAAYANCPSAPLPPTSPPTPTPKPGTTPTPTPAGPQTPVPTAIPTAVG